MVTHDPASTQRLVRADECPGPAPGILLVDDDPVLLELERRALSSAFPVVAVGSIPEACAALADVRVGVLLTDLRLGTGSGLDLANESAAHRPDVIRLLLSASVELDAPGRVFGPAFHRTLRKPVPPAELREVVAHAADVWLLRRRNAELRSNVIIPHHTHPAGAPETNGTGVAVGSPLRDAVATFERQLIADTLVALRGNKSAAARHLGLTYRGLLLKMQRYGMVPANHRQRDR